MEEGQISESTNGNVSKPDANDGQNSEGPQPRTLSRIPSWLPDWTKEEDYPDPRDESVTKEQWAWEFLRRNPKYQMLYRIGRRHKESWYKKYPNNNKFYRYFNCSPKAIKGESYSDYLARCELKGKTPKIIPRKERILELFPVGKYSNKLNPANAQPPEFNKDYGYPLCYATLEDEEEIILLMPDSGEISLVFNVALPIKSQIDKANNFLKGQQKYYENQGNKLFHKGRIQMDSLRNYLRYLDGVTHGATPTEIARTVHKLLDLNGARQRVDKGIKKALNLRDIGYLKFLQTEILK